MREPWQFVFPWRKGKGPSPPHLLSFPPFLPPPRKRYVYVPHCPTGPGMDCPLVIDPTGVAPPPTQSYPFPQVYFRREGQGGSYLCGQSPTEDQEPGDTDLDTVDSDWFEEQVPHVMSRYVMSCYVMFTMSRYVVSCSRSRCLMWQDSHSHPVAGLAGPRAESRRL